jgi:hypothetical protein
MSGAQVYFRNFFLIRRRIEGSDLALFVLVLVLVVVNRHFIEDDDDNSGACSGVVNRQRVGS